MIVTSIQYEFETSDGKKYRLIISGDTIEIIDTAHSYYSLELSKEDTMSMFNVIYNETIGKNNG